MQDMGIHPKLSQDPTNTLCNINHREKVIFWGPKTVPNSMPEISQESLRDIPSLPMLSLIKCDIHPLSISSTTISRNKFRHLEPPSGLSKSHLRDPNSMSYKSCPLPNRQPPMLLYSYPWVWIHVPISAKISNHSHSTFEASLKSSLHSSCLHKHPPSSTWRVKLAIHTILSSV